MTIRALNSLFAAGLFGGGLLALPAAAAPSWRFSFAPGAAPAGVTAVSPATRYSDAAGFGFEPGSPVTAIDRPGHGGFVTGSQPFYFSVKLPEGNYQVVVSLGDPAGSSVTTVKAELRRLMLQRIRTADGAVVSRAFNVAIRRPSYPGGQVRLKPREKTTETWSWDDKLTLEFCDEHPAVSSVEIVPVPSLPTLFLVGDSTMTDQAREPHNSWGQMITRFFGPGIVVASHAESGESARDFIGEHRWPKVMSMIKPGDFVMIQFGHNDQHDRGPNPGAYASYTTFLKQYVADVRQHGAAIILVTPMNRLAFDGGTLVNTLGDFPDAVRKICREEQVPLVDLNAMSKVLYEALGPGQAPALFAPSPSGGSDTTHQQDYGSYELAQCVVRGIRSAAPDLARYLAPDATHFDPAHPDPVAGYDIPKEPVTKIVRPYGN
ncbi:MAG TPA: rhamnogalacturonan acetylesterase [Opitutaceae bacterium]|nr:rhamnogalacturonan acetylesterase [Opitutaceae bacterium]